MNFRPLSLSIDFYYIFTCILGPAFAIAFIVPVPIDSTILLNFLACMVDNSRVFSISITFCSFTYLLSALRAAINCLKLASYIKKEMKRNQWKFFITKILLTHFYEELWNQQTIINVSLPQCICKLFAHVQSNQVNTFSLIILKFNFKKVVHIHLALTLETISTWTLWWR